MNALLVIAVLLGIALSFAIPVFFVWKFIVAIKGQGEAFREVVLESAAATATVENILGGNARVGESAGGSHSRVAVYTFEVPEKGEFRGEFTTFDYEVGDELKIEYSPENPDRNFPAFLAEEGRRTAPEGLREKFGKSDPES